MSINVYIDGENLRHRVKDVLVEEKIIDKTEETFSFDLSGLVQQNLPKKDLSLAYYTTRVRKPNYEVPKEMFDKIERIQIANRPWLSQLSNQGIQIIKAGYLHIRESGACAHCGKRTMVPQEKGVDVRLATDIVLDSVKNKAKQVAIVSSDSDLLPAIEVARKGGTKVIYLVFKEQVNRAIRKAADETIYFDRQAIINAYHDKVKL